MGRLATSRPVTDKDEGGGRRLFFGRRKGRPLAAAMQRRLERDLPARLVPPATGAPEDPRNWFSARPEAVWLEIGFGGGEHLAWQARGHPGVGIVGCEPFVNGVASLLRHLEAVEQDTVRIHPDDAGDILQRIAPATLERIFVLHPDPWPKRRHHPRRLIQHETVSALHDLLKPGGVLRLATDDPGYLTWMLVRLTAHRGLRWTGTRMANFLDRPEDWPETRYEAKARREGRPPVYLEFRRIA